jgi:hypothetical protein
MLKPFFEWMQAYPMSVAIQESWWIGAAVNIAHLLSLAFFIGGILIVDLRLLGVGMTKQSVAQVYRDARPWMIGGLCMMVLTGIPQLFSLAIRNYYNFYFWLKMSILPFAVLYTFTIRQWVARTGDSRVGQAKVVGGISMVVWLGIVVIGRLIALT